MPCCATSTRRRRWARWRGSRRPPTAPTGAGYDLRFLRYHIHINTPDEAITFHDQVGYWLWEPATGLVLQEPHRSTELLQEISSASG